MANPKDTKMIRDMLGSPVPQTLNDDGTYTVLANGDVSDVDFRRTKLLRDKLGSVLPQQYFDVEQGRFVPGTIGGGSGASNWNEIQGKPTEFPTSVEKVDGLEDALNGKLNSEDLTSVNQSLEQVTTQLAQSNERLDDNAISPDDFEGTDYEKVQQALDYAIENYVAIRFSRMYNITGGGSLKINKATGSWDLDRRALYLIGIGGGIQKDDAGFIFTAPLHKIGDIIVNGLKYSSVVGVGTIVWDFDKLIRVHSMNCQYFNVDTVASAPNQYFQSIRFTKEHITGGMGWVFEFRESYDLTFDGCLIEARQHGIRNTEGLAAAQNRNLRVQNCCIEGLTGIPIRLGSNYGAVFIGNYFESNGGLLGDDRELTDQVQIDFKTLGNAWYQYGVVLIGNRFSMKSTQLTANTPAVDHGPIFNGSTNGGLSSISNVSNGVLHRISTNEQGYIIATSDIATTALLVPESRKNRYLYLSRPINAIGTYNTVTTWGAFTKQYVSTPLISFNAGETKTIDIVADKPPIAGDPVTISLTNSANFQILSQEYVSNAMRVNVKNLGSTTMNTTITMTVLKMF